VNILIIDDQYDKVQVIVGILKEFNVFQIDQVVCSRDALRKMRETKYDLLILDLQIPEALGDDVNPVGGKAFLEYININEEICYPAHIIGITSHQESFDKCKEYFFQNGCSLVHGVEDKAYITNLIKAKVKQSAKVSIKYDIVLLAALEHVELKAILNVPCDWKIINDPADCNIYYSGNVQVKSGEVKSVIATSLPRMGMAAASAVAMKACLKFNPEYLIMTGIAAGIEGKVQLGDILVADSCWDWGSGKLTVDESGVKFLSSPHQLALDPKLQGMLKNISVNRTYLDEIYCNWKAPNKRPPHDLNLHIGPLATGAVVLEDPATVALVKSQHRNIIGIEMEAYGMLAAANLAANCQPRTLVIKSVCDFADPLKNDDWQSYAAYTSASFAFKLLKNNLFP